MSQAAETSKSVPGLSAKPTGRVLVVDDEEHQRRALTLLLGALGHESAEASTGEQALTLVQEWAPDVVLLDVMMPGMKGFEVCQRIKQNPKTAAIHVILVTGLTGRKDRLAGIRAGADDFLNKPVDSQEVGLRVRNALIAKDLFDQVQKNYEELRELERLRDRLVHLIVHDLRAPLMGASAYLKLHRTGAANAGGQEQAADLDEAQVLIQHVLEMVSSVLDVSRLESREMPLDREPCCLGDLARETVEALGALARQGGVELKLSAADVRVTCDRRLILRTMVNLVTNAIAFSPEDADVQIVVEGQGDEAKVAVVDHGPGIPPEYRVRVFEKFGQVDGREQGDVYSTGLGLSFCKEAVEAHGGSIWVESVVDEGSTFFFTLPAGDCA